jgi:signal transduction histidine kinase
LQISLLDSSNLIRQDEEYFVDEQIRSVLQLTQLEWESKNIEFDLNLEEINYLGNKELTFQIWQNLISNAIKFSKENSKIRILLKKENEIFFEIEDFGQGISLVDQSKIFSQFFIANTSRNKSGSGLGLSITKKIVEKLGGSIHFESVENQGTIFYVKLLCK